MSGYPTIRLSEPNLTILRASESDFLESNTIWPFPYPTFSEFGAKFGKKWVIFDEIFDFLGIRIWLFEILNYPNRSESNYLISDDICIRLFGIRSFTKNTSLFVKKLHIYNIHVSIRITNIRLVPWKITLYLYLEKTFLH